MPVGGFLDESAASPGKPTAPRWPRREDGEACAVADRARGTAVWAELLLGWRETGLGPALPLIASKRWTMSEMDVRRVVRCDRGSGEGTSRLVLPPSTGDDTGNFTATVAGELRNIDCGRGRAVALPVDAEGGGPVSRPFVDCLRCLDGLRVETDRSGSGLVESVEIDGEMSGDGEVERGFDDWPVGGNKKSLLGLISSGSCEVGIGPVDGDGPLSPPEDFVRPSLPPHRSTSSCTELCRDFDLLFR
jgi:hypothetical protein